MQFLPLILMLAITQAAATSVGPPLAEEICS
jgi:hypothetical protein